MEQFTEVIGYIHSKDVVHRDLKLENTLIDDNLNIVVADFGFATFRKVRELTSYKGTMTYMAPEIKEHKVYDGKAADVFSLGVILFTLVAGTFPFCEARRDDRFYTNII